MADFYAAYRNVDWDKMTRIAGRFKSVDAWFDNLVSGARAVIHFPIKEATMDWSGGEFIRPHQMVDIAFHLVAASQSVPDPARAKLTAEQRTSIRRVWGALLVAAYNEIGAPGDPPPDPDDVSTATDYLNGANAVAARLEDVCPVFTKEAMAWLAARQHDDATAERLKVPGILWPPVARNGKQLTVQMPDLPGLEP